MNESDMWQVEPAAAELFGDLPKLTQLTQTLEQAGDDVKADTTWGVVGTLFGAPFASAFGPQIAALSSLGKLTDQFKSLLENMLNDSTSLTGLANIEPIYKTMKDPANFAPEFQQSSGIRLQIAMVALEDGQLHYVTETGAMVERDGHNSTIVEVADPACAGPILKQLAEVANELKSLVDGRQLAGNKGPFVKPTQDPDFVRLRRAASDLRGKLAACPRIKQTVNVDLVLAARASSSIPVIFTPVEISGSRYVDGGVRTLAPIEAAINAGASIVYAVCASTSKMDFENDLEPAVLPLLAIALRVGEQIMPDEVGHRDLLPINGWPLPVIVIQPEAEVDDIHDGMTIDPGLIRIRMAHGFMRAYDTLRAHDEDSSAVRAFTERNSRLGHTTAIVQLRRQIWEAEFAANGKQLVPGNALPPTPPTVLNVQTDPAALEKVKHMKDQLLQLLADRVNFYTDATHNIAGIDSLPADFNDWTRQWEKHTWTPSGSLTNLSVNLHI